MSDPDQKQAEWVNLTDSKNITKHRLQKRNKNRNTCEKKLKKKLAKRNKLWVIHKLSRTNTIWRNNAIIMVYWKKTETIKNEVLHFFISTVINDSSTYRSN